MKRATHFSLLLAPLALALAGCSKDDSDNGNDGAPGAPTFSSSPVTTASVGTKYEYLVTTDDATGDPRTIAAPTLPAWLVLEDAGDGTAKLSGIPTPVDTGQQSVELQVSDKDGANGQNFQIEVTSDFVSNAVEDEFDGDTLNEIWQFYDPLQDSQLLIAEGEVQISVPEGVPHDLWVGDENTAPRILQQVDNKDFGIEVKFNSEPTKRYQMHGVIAQETPDKFVRFELHHDGTTQRIYAASIDGTVARIRVNQVVEGSPPNTLRIMRNGEFWTLQYAADGANWVDAAAFSQPLEVTGIGLFGGNARGKNSPAFTARADYFRNTDLSSLPSLQLPEAPGANPEEPKD